MMDISLNELRNQPKSHVIKKALEKLNNGGPVIDLETVMTIIQNIIPVFQSLEEHTKTILFEIASNSYVFIVQIVKFTSTLSKDQKEIKIYKNFLISTLESSRSCLYNYITQFTKRRIEVQILKAFFFGSKLFNLLSSEIHIIEYLELLKSQWEKIAEQIVFGKVEDQNLKCIGELLVAQLSLHPVYATDKIIDEIFMLSDDNFKSLSIILENSTTLDRQRIVSKHLIQYLESKINERNYVDIYIILQQISAYKYFNFSTILNLKSLHLQALLLICLPSIVANKVFLRLILQFADPEETIDKNVCELLTILMKYVLTEKQVSDISHNPEFLNAVTTRLSNKNNEIRDTTMFIAKLASNGQLKYDSDFSIEIPDLNVKYDGIRKVNFSLLHSDLINTDSSSKNSMVKLINDVKTLTFQGLSDSDDDDSDDDKDNNSRSIRDVVFIKDLAEAYVNYDKGQNGHMIPLLKHTVKLVRQKAFFPLEVGYYSGQLMSSICILNNVGDESNFEQWRINALVSLLVVVPDKVDDLLAILFSSELSLQQRMSILSCFGLAARELRGLDDKQISKPSYDFPTKRLWWDNKENKDKLIEDIPEENTDLISIGKTLWQSKKLQGKKTEDDVNNFRKYAPKFFYPLAHGWLNGIDLGTFNQIFKTHYFTTLRIIYTCSYPVHDYESMTQLIEQIASEAIQQGITVEN